MKRAISIAVVLLAIFFVLSACGSIPQPGPSPDPPSPSLPNVNGNYSGTYQFGSDSGKMSLDIGGQDGTSFSGQVELDLSPGSAICYSTNVNIIPPTNVYPDGSIKFSAYCGPDNPALHFTGTAQSGGGWKGQLQDDSNNTGRWTVTPSSS